MVIKKNITLVAAAVAAITISAAAGAAQADSALTVSATLTSGCSVSAASAINFANFSTLESGDQTSDTAGSFTVACSADALPKIFATGTREIVGGTPSTAIPFNLSMTAGAAADDLPLTLATAESLVMTQDGAAHAVPVYATILQADYVGLGGGTYTSTGLTLSVSY